MSMMQQNADGTWSEAIPEPFWFRHWFQWKPGCYECSMQQGRDVQFRSRAKWEAHYRDKHLNLSAT